MRDEQEIGGRVTQDSEIETIRRLWREDLQAIIEDLEFKLRPHVSVQGERTPYMTVRDLQNELGFSEPFILKLCADPAFPAIKIGTTWRVSRADFVIWFEGKKKDKAESQIDPHA